MTNSPCVSEYRNTFTVGSSEHVAGSLILIFSSQCSTDCLQLPSMQSNTLVLLLCYSWSCPGGLSYLQGRNDVSLCEFPSGCSGLGCQEDNDAQALISGSWAYAIFIAQCWRILGLRAHETELSLLRFLQAQPEVGSNKSGTKISQPVLPSCAKNILCLTAFWVTDIF